MNSPFQSGDQVYWWKGRSREVGIPVRAEVVKAASNRVSILCKEASDGVASGIRHVPPDRLQRVGVFYEKAIHHRISPYEPMSQWGCLTSYLEVAEDLWALRRVDQYEGGQSLSYDRTHWGDRFGILGDGRIKRPPQSTEFWESFEIEPAEFERVWQTALQSPLREQQVASSRMHEFGAEPIWLAIHRQKQQRKTQQ